jgi:hypothetical protein
MKVEITQGTLDPVLQAYVDSRDRVSIITGPLGSGKTYASCLRLLKQMCEQKPNRQGIRKSRWVAIRNTFPDLQTTTIKDWLELWEDLGRFKQGGISPPTHYLNFKLQDKSIVQAELVFVAMDRPATVKKLRGTQITGFWFNEIKELDKSIIDMADLRHGRYPSPMDGGPTWHGMIGDTNQCDDDHWLYKMAQVTKPKNWSFFVQPGGLMREMRSLPMGRQEWTGKWIPNELAENVHNLIPNYYMQGQEGKSTSWISVNLANEYGSSEDGKAIYGEQWSDDLHVSENITIIEDWPIVIGMDFGLTPAAIIGQETPNGTLHILEELVAEGMGINQFANEVLLPTLRNKYKSNEPTFIGDPSGHKRSDTDEQTVFKELYELGINAEAANTNNPQVRWEAVRYFLQQLRDGKPAFLLHPRCKMLRKGFNGGYKLRRIQLAGSEKFSEKADKNKFSHPHDGLQYLALHIKGDIGDTSEFERDDTPDRWAL